jgi:hypothetical protein
MWLFPSLRPVRGSCEPNIESSCVVLGFFIAGSFPVYAQRRLDIQLRPH